MKFKALGMIKYPINTVWELMRDDLESLVGYLNDIKSIHVESKHDEGDEWTIVNVWKASPQIPKIVLKYIDTKMFVWTDTAKWDNTKNICHWVIEPHSFKNFISCEGTTTFTQAMGGRGTRIVFQGEIMFSSNKILGIPIPIEGPVMKGAERLIQYVVPKNFRKIVDAMGKYLKDN